MKFFYARKTLKCRGCRSIINRGEVCIRTSHKNKQTGVTYGFIYHYECYLEDYVEKVRKSALYWLQQQLPPKKRGRPRKYSSPKEADRLRALIYYHEKAGNIKRIAEVMNELNKLFVR